MAHRILRDGEAASRLCVPARPRRAGRGFADLQDGGEGTHLHAGLAVPDDRARAGRAGRSGRAAARARHSRRFARHHQGNLAGDPRQRGRNVSGAAEAVRESASITAEKALEKKVIDVIAGSREALMGAINGREIKVRDASRRLKTADPEFLAIEMTAEQQFYFFLAQPTVIFLLLVGGAGALYVEFTHPGVVPPAVVGAICMRLGAIGLSIVPINLTGAALMGLGIVLLLSELFVPSFGALGLGGGACLLIEIGR